MSKLNKTIYTITNGQVEAVTIAEMQGRQGFVDELPTKHGVLPRVFIEKAFFTEWRDSEGFYREAESIQGALMAINDDVLHGCISVEQAIKEAQSMSEGIRWNVKKWDFGGDRTSIIESFDTEGEAVEKLEDFAIYDFERAQDLPVWFYTEFEAKEWLAEQEEAN